MTYQHHHTLSALRCLLATMFCIVIASSVASKAESALDIIDMSAKKIAEAPSLAVTFTISHEGVTSTGSLTLAGDKFHIYTPSMSVWYDGSTQWTMLPEAREVDITTPTNEELDQVNPLAILNHFKSRFTAKLSTGAPAGCRKLELTARSADGPVKRAILVIDQSTRYPKSIILTLADGRDINISINAMKPGDKLPLSTFVFDKSKYPGLEIVDLR